MSTISVSGMALGQSISSLERSYALSEYGTTSTASNSNSGIAQPITGVIATDANYASNTFKRIGCNAGINQIVMNSHVANEQSLDSNGNIITTYPKNYPITVTEFTCADNTFGVNNQNDVGTSYVKVIETDNAYDDPLSGLTIKCEDGPITSLDMNRYLTSNDTWLNTVTWTCDGSRGQFSDSDTNSDTNSYHGYITFDKSQWVQGEDYESANYANKAYFQSSDIVIKCPDDMLLQSVTPGRDQIQWRCYKYENPTASEKSRYSSMPPSTTTNNYTLRGLNIAPNNPFASTANQRWRGDWLYGSETTTTKSQEAEVNSPYLSLNCGGKELTGVQNNNGKITYWCGQPLSTIRSYSRTMYADPRAPVNPDWRGIMCDSGYVLADISQTVGPYGYVTNWRCGKR